MSDLSSYMDSLESSVSKVEDLLKPLLALPHDQHLARLEPLDKAKLEIVVAYTLNTLWFTYLKTQGESPKEHPVKHELDRIKEYVNKLKKAAGAPRGGMRVDRKVADRFILHTLRANPEVKAAELKRRREEEEAEEKEEVEAEGGEAVEIIEDEAEEQASEATAPPKPKKKRAKKKGKGDASAASSVDGNQSPEVGGQGRESGKSGAGGSSVATPPPRASGEKGKKKDKKPAA